jgi:hypothetical protein
MLARVVDIAAVEESGGEVIAADFEREARLFCCHGVPHKLFRTGLFGHQGVPDTNGAS